MKGANLMWPGVVDPKALGEFKKDEVRRNTDGFSAFVCALWQADQILVDDVDFLVGDIEY